MWGWVSIIHFLLLRGGGHESLPHKVELPMVVSEQSISVVGASQEWPVLYRCLSVTSCRFFLCKPDCATPFSAAGAIFLPGPIDWTPHSEDQSVMLLRLLILSLDSSSILLAPVHHTGVNRSWFFAIVIAGGSSSVCTKQGC